MASFIVGLTVASFRPAETVVDPSLDLSIVATYPWFTASGAHFGSDVVSVVGPYGFVHFGYCYAGDLYWVRLLLELAMKAAFATLVAWVFFESAARVVRWFWLAAIVLILPIAQDTVYDLLVLFSCLFLLKHEPRGKVDWATIGAILLLALLALTKSTQIVLSLLGLGLVLLDKLRARRPRGAVLVTGIFLFAFLGFWLLARQNPADLPVFLRGVAELSSGFNSAMGLEEPILTTAIGVSILVSLVATCAWSAASQHFAARPALPAAWLAIFAFFMWKHGFVRADAHVMFFFDFALICAPLAWMIRPAGSRGSRVGFVLTALTFVLAGSAVLSNATLSQWAQTFRHAAESRAQQLAHPLRQRALLEAELDHRRADFALPKLQKIIGGGSIDFFGDEEGYILLNRLNYHPRPMGGGNFEVYNEYLKKRNETFLLNPERRPEFYLLKLDRLDQRLVSQEDSRTFLQLLYLYRPVEVEFPLYLLRRRTAAQPAPSPVEISRQAFRWNEPIDVPKVSENRGDLIFATIDIEPNWLGRLRSFFYKPPEIFLKVTGDSAIATPEVRLIPAMARSPILVNPLIENSDDFVRLYTDASGEKSVRTFRVFSSRPEFFDASSFSIRFLRLPRPPPDPHSSEVLALAHFPITNVPPEFDSHKSNPHPVDGVFADSFHTPARTVFALTGREREIIFGFGIEAGAYLTGDTDGAELIVELMQHPGQRPTPLFRRYLQPKTVAADRGTQTAIIALPLVRPGAKLILRSDPGPRGSEAWDWVYVTRFEFVSGPQTLDKFPGFNLAPVLVDSDFAGANKTPDGLPVFSLNAPGEMVFELTKMVRTVSFTCGFMPGAYTGDGNSDGATFLILLQSGTGAPTQLASRILRPKSHPQDRGPLEVEVAIPPHAAGDHLILRTDPGPNGDRSWDWTYIANLHIK